MLRASRLQAVRSRVDATSNLQGKAQVHYPSLHENPKNNTSPIKYITYKVLSLNKAKHNNMTYKYLYLL